MTALNTPTFPELGYVHPFIRYVDEDQAIIDAHIEIKSRIPAPCDEPPPEEIDVLVELDAADGFHDEQQQTVPLTNLRGMVRMEVVRPQRWWPAGMGEQSLYDLTISLLVKDQIIDMISTSVGLTSVRTGAGEKIKALMVNGRRYPVENIVPIDAVDEDSLLPVSRDSLLVIRDHYGPDVLYHAADRAGILLVQCVPIHAEGRPEAEVEAEVARLLAHPSLAGWCVGHLGDLSRQVAGRLRRLDPTHDVFLDVPADWAA